MIAHQKSIDAYIKENLRKTYNISDLSGEEEGIAETSEFLQENIADISGNENEGFIADISGNENKGFIADIDEKVVYTVSEEEWKEQRNNDFYEFYTYVKSLPDVENVIVSKEDPNEEAATSEELEKYNDTEVLEIISLLQRDLLGEITNVEKAFNYFKYTFPKMAYFSLFIAIFFDLGAFFAGGFLYVTEFFLMGKKKKCKRKGGSEETCDLKTQVAGEQGENTYEIARGS